jgi:hypothetical protein
VSDRRAHLIYAAASIALALVMAAYLDAELSLSLADGLWFELLVAVVLAAFLMEPQYSGIAAAATNAVAVTFVALGADPSKLKGWWTGLLLAGLATLALSFVPYLLRDPQGTSSGSRLRRGRIIAQVVSQVGAWRSILLAALALSLATFNAPYGPEWATSAVVGLFVLGVARLQPHRLIATWSNKQGAGTSGVAVTRFAPPREVVLSETEPGTLTRGTLVSLRSDRGSATGMSSQRRWSAAVTRGAPWHPTSSRASPVRGQRKNPRL